MKGIRATLFKDNDLRECPPAHKGMMIHCPVCLGNHPLKCGIIIKNGVNTEIETEDYLYYVCDKTGEEYLGAICKKLVIECPSERMPIG